MTDFFTRRFNRSEKQPMTVFDSLKAKAEQSTEENALAVYEESIAAREAKAITQEQYMQIYHLLTRER